MKTNLASWLCSQSAAILLIINCEYIMIFQSFSRLLCISEKRLDIMSLQPLYLHHANMLNCRVWCTFPYPRWSVLIVTLTLQVINTGASVCKWSSEKNADSRSISSPPSIPSVSIVFFFLFNPHPPVLAQPLFFTKLSHCHHIPSQPQAGRVTARSATFHLHTHTHTTRATLSVAPASTAPSCFIRNIIPSIQNPMGSIDL